MKFIEPKNIDEGKQIIRGLLQEIEGIDMQLREREASVVSRVPNADYAEYRAWRAKAINAKAFKQQTVRQYKEWVAVRTRQPVRDILSHFDANDPRLLVGNLIGIVGRACKDGFEPTTEEQAFIDAAKRYATGKYH